MIHWRMICRQKKMYEWILAVRIRFSKSKTKLCLVNWRESEHIGIVSLKLNLERWGEVGFLHIREAPSLEARWTKSRDAEHHTWNRLRKAVSLNSTSEKRDFKASVVTGHGGFWIASKNLPIIQMCTAFISIVFPEFLIYGDNLSNLS